MWIVEKPRLHSLVSAPSGDQATTLTGDDGAGDMLDITIDDAGMTGTVDGHPVTLTRTCGG